MPGVQDNVDAGASAQGLPAAVPVWPVWRSRPRPAPSARPLSEDAFLEAVVNLAHMYGWICAHHSKSARKVGERWVSNIKGDKGSPDLVLVRPPRVIFAELKLGSRARNAKGHLAGGSYGLTPEQKIWLDALRECPGVQVFVWTPGQIEEIALLLTSR